MKNRGCVIGLIALLAVATIGLSVYFIGKMQSNPDRFEVEKPIMTDIIKKSVATGAINPRQEVSVKPQVSGVIDALFVEEGELVKKGQQLSRIKLVPSEVNINNAKSNVELARIRYDEARRELQRQKEVFDKRLDVEAAKANYQNALQEEQRYRDLFEEGVISEQEYNRYKLDLELQKTALDNSEIVAQNNLKQFEADVDIRKQELDAAINNLQLLKEGASNNSKQVANVVTSTLDGMILDIPVKEGSSVIERNNFNEGTTIASIANMNELIFEGKVDEADVGKLKEGMPLIITVGAIPDQTFEATLEFISPKGIEEEGTVKFEVRAAMASASLDNAFLRAGYSANADIILDTREKVVAVKERDVLFEEDTTFVEVQTGSQQFEKRQVALGLSDGVNIEVLNGLDTTTNVKVQQKL
jgi:HlyD family secretion protein